MNRTTARSALHWSMAIALLVCPSLFGLDPRRRLEENELATWTDSLPQNTVHAIHQTRDGYLWIGTYEGLVRFDGVRFTVFDKRTFPLMRQHGTLDVFEDSHGNLWAGTSGGGVVRMAANSSERFDTAKGLAGDIVTSIQEDRAGRVWIATTRGVNQYANGRLQTIASPAGAVPRRLFCDADGGMWIGYENGSIDHIVDGSRSRYDASRGVPPKAILAIAQDRGGAIWIGSEGGGLSVLHDDRFEPVSNAGFPPNAIVRALLCDRAGTLWIGTEGLGLFRLWNGTVSSMTSRQGLPSDIVRSLFEDREGSLWIGTSGSGLAVLRDQKFVTYSRLDGLSHDNVRCIFEDRPGSVWIGTDGGGVNHLTGATITALTTKEGLANDYVRALFGDADGTLWIGTAGAGLSRLKDGKLAHFTSHDGLPNDVVYAIQRDRDGVLWVGTSRGVARLRNNQFEAVPDRGVADTNTTALALDRHGVLWIGTGRGALRHHDGVFEPVMTRDGAVRDSVFSFHEDSDGTMWIGTTNGLLRVRDGIARRYNREQGLYDDLVFQVLDDERGFLWMSSNRGVARVAKSELDALDAGKIRAVQSVSYGRPDGMLSAQCNGVSQPAALRTSDGRLWFATIRGVAVVAPSELRLNPLPPPVVVERVVADGKTLSTSSVTLAPGHDRLEIDYSAMSFIAPEKVQFRYRLEGKDSDWTDPGSRRTAFYNNLPPGRYRFHVIASNNDGVWNRTGASLSIELQPFFHQTLAFRFLVAAMFLGLLLTLHRMRLRSIKLQRRALTVLVEQRTAELEAANRELARLSSLDGLTSIANRRQFDLTLVSEWSRALRDRSELSLLMIDIDSFKAFNDTLGHKAGDECLRRVAQTIAAEFRRAEDLVARYGGEELAVLLPGMGLQDAAKNAERVRAAVESLKILHPASTVARVVTISVGIATVTPQDSDEGALVAAADEALYRAKGEGKNRVA